MAERDKQPIESVEPGQVIAPGSSQSTLQQPQATTPPAAAELSSDIPEERQQLYRVPLAKEDETTKRSSGGAVSWTASEFVAHEKNVRWYGGLTLAASVVAVIIYFLTKDIMSTAVVLVCAAAFGILGGKKPRQLQYHLDDSGITVGPKRYTYEMFRSFSVVTEGAFSSIVFMPLKRFAPLTTIYCAPEDETKIINILTNRLPVEEHKDAAIDSLMKRIRF